LRGAQRRGNPDKISAAIRRLGKKAEAKSRSKKRKKVWIASRHASLAVAMTGQEPPFSCSLLEHFPIKWLPVDRRKCDKNKKIERPT